MVKFFVTGSRKKRIVFLLSLFQLACYCNAQISTFVPIKDNVAWFPFNSSISDSSGKGNHLTNYNGVKAINDRFGVANNARYFNGTNQDLKSSHSSSLTISSDLTLCAWILDSNTNSKYQTIIAKRQSGFWNYALTISHDTLITKKGRNKVVTSRRNVGPVVDFKFSLDTIPLNRWVHVAVAVKSDTVRFYLDGREISCLVDSNILFPKSFGKVFSIPAKDPLGGLSVGSDNDGGEFFKGRLDDVGIWRRALTVCEIRALSKSKAWIDLKPFHGFVYRKCGIDSLAMNAVSGMKTYLWSVGSTKQKLIVKKSGKYSVLMNDSFGCEYRDTITVVFSNPKFSFSSDSLLLKNCKRDSLRVSVGSKWKSVVWSHGKKDSVVFLKNSGFYSVLLTDTNDCKVSDTTYFGNPGKVDLVLLSIDSVKCNAGNTGRIVTSLFGGFVPLKLKWNDPLGQTTPTVVDLSAGNYRGILQDRFGCSDTLDAIVGQPKLLYATVAATDSVNCFGGKDGRAFVSVTGGISPYTYMWNSTPPQYTALATGLSAGFYRVWVTDNYGCSDSSSAMVYEPDSITLEIMGGIHTMKGSKIQLTSVAMPIQPYFYSWEPKSIFGNQWNLKEPNVIIPNSGIVKLTITNLKGCPLSDTAYIKVVLPPKEFMPTGFTPNGDGLNQGFGVPDIFETVSFIIYDRWGGKVFSGDNNHPRWDGTINGELASPGVYVYMFEAILKGTNQRISYGGSVTLIR